MGSFGASPIHMNFKQYEQPETPQEQPLVITHDTQAVLSNHNTIMALDPNLADEEMAKLMTQI